MRTQVCGLIMLYNGVNVKKWSHFILGVFNYYVVKHTYVGPTYILLGTMYLLCSLLLLEVG